MADGQLHRDMTKTELDAYLSSALRPPGSPRAAHTRPRCQ